MKIVYRAENIIDAHLVKNALEQAEIIAYVSGHYLTGAAGELPVIGLVNVMVAAHQFDAAEAVVAEVDAALREARQAFDEQDDPGALPLPA